MTLEQATVELRAREPIFHRPEFGTTREDFDRMMEAEFFEIGASGKLYSRAFVLDVLAERQGEDDPEPRIAGEFAVRHLGGSLYQATYVLLQPPARYTRRSTLWRYDDEAWTIVFHQGTIVRC